MSTPLHWSDALRLGTDKIVAAGWERDRADRFLDAVGPLSKHLGMSFNQTVDFLVEAARLETEGSPQVADYVWCGLAEMVAVSNKGGA